jgi:tetratricopeptide (TPR) repeat protein
MREIRPSACPVGSATRRRQLLCGLRAALAFAILVSFGCGERRSDLRDVAFDLDGMDPAVVVQLRAAEAAALAAPVDPAGAEAWGVLGETCQAYALLPAAFAAYANATGLAPEEPRWWYLMGAVAVEESRFDDASRYLSRAAELAPDRSPPLVAQATLELMRGNADEAVRLAHIAIAADGADMGGWLALAEAESVRNRPQEAVDAYRTIIQRQPEATKVVAPLVSNLRLLGLHDKAAELQFRGGDRPVVRRDPWMERVLARREGFDAETRRASQLYELGRYVEAALGFEAALALRPDDVPTMVNLAGCRLRVGEFDLAAEALGRALELDPDNPIAWFDLGSAEVGRGRDEAAVAAYQRSVELRPQSLVAIGELGDALRRLGRWQEALDRYRAVLEQQGDLEPALAWGAVCLVRLDRFVEARQWLKSALQKRPESTALAGLAARLLATAADPAARDGAQALKVARQLEQIVPAPIHLELVGLALAETGDWAAAMEKVDLALAELPEGRSELRARLERERIEYAASRPYRDFGGEDLFIRDAVRDRLRLAGSR